VGNYGSVGVTLFMCVLFCVWCCVCVVLCVCGVVCVCVCLVLCCVCEDYVTLRYSTVVVFLISTVMVIINIIIMKASAIRAVSTLQML